MSTKFLFDYTQMPFGAMAATRDPDCLAHLENFNPVLTSVLMDQTLSQEFCNQYKSWIASSKLNTWQGLDEFKYAVMAHGTTEVFDKFYIKNSTRRFRCFNAEYKYHELTWRSHPLGWKRIEDGDIEVNDAVVISLPFSDTGDQHILHAQVLEQCSKLGVPVLLDCAWFGICQGINFDLTHPCITDVSVSLSKTFPVAHARIGMRLTRVDNDDALFVLQKTNYINRFSAALGLHFINKFGPDYIAEKYRDTQLQFCEILRLDPSPTVLMATSTTLGTDYNRGGATNRLSFHRFLPEDQHSLFYQIARDLFDREAFLQ
jgi:hypothetical protein